MKACTFFGHRDDAYGEYKDKIKDVLIYLIEKEGVGQFYCGGRGKFDGICSGIVFELKKQFPWIKSTLVLSYIPKDGFLLPEKYDDSVYLLEKKVLPKFAIWETNRLLVQKCDFVISAVWKDGGGAYRAVKYAKSQGKRVIDIYALH